MADRPKNGTRPGSGDSPARARIQAEALRLTKLLEPTVRQSGLVLEEVEVRLAGAHRTVHVVVDLPEDRTEGVGLDQIADVSRAVSDVLDTDAQDDGGPFDLEVSSPGATRPLTEPRHWRRNLGRVVTVRRSAGADLTGRLLEVDEESVLLRPRIEGRKGVRPKDADPVRVPFAEIRKGTVELEFTRLDDETTGGTEAVDPEPPTAEEA